MSDEKDTMKTMRKSLMTLQRKASDIDVENLVGRVGKNLKHHSQDAPAEIEVKRKNLSTKETQADLSNKITIEDLTNPAGASDNYWKILAEKRLKTLQETLDENSKLKQHIEELEITVEKQKKMLDEANAFIEVFQEVVNNEDDTGIDVNDVSTTDEATDADVSQDADE